ncbi:MAG: VCBS repeat-containing protein, partial [Planctomycetes bacterium]|nr:VCBS repeat-containing protein [Planctomycetota bacterium]
MDWDHDGRTDVLSGSWPGEIYFFRGREDGGFAEAETLQSEQGEAVNVGSAAAAHAADWNGDGLLDLLVGVIDGSVSFLPRQQRDGALVLGEPQRLDLRFLDDVAISDAGPVAADWDGDGRLDLLVGADDGSVWLFRGRREDPGLGLSEGSQLVPPSPARGGDAFRQDGDWGHRIKLCPT